MYPAVNLVYFCYSFGSLFAAKNYSMLFPNENFGQTPSGSSRSNLRFNPPSISSLLVNAHWTEAEAAVRIQRNPEGEV